MTTILEERSVADGAVGCNRSSTLCIGKRCGGRFEDVVDVVEELFNRLSQLFDGTDLRIPPRG